MNIQNLRKKIIDRDWFYILDNSSPSEIKINSQNVILYDKWEWDKKIYLSEWSCVEAYWFIYGSVNYDIKYISNEPDSKIKIWYLIISNDEEKLKINISSIIESDNINSNVDILSIANQGWNIDLTWSINIWKNICKIEWKLRENNIFVWEKWKISWLPILTVSSSDVVASHSARFEKIDDEKLYYIRTRWLSQNQAVNMILEWYIKDLFRCLKMFDNVFYESVIKKALGRIY